ncbi:hypothetical protein J2787_000217 [Chryseobacterium rhizosphaerae]|uniref:Uncharacterized protein n=1 Tax=Chryseobacterium rhizosphaerae TaxID=395937 RepID=A0AAE3Y6C2_9FLAO|nr:hypothetical protein [Chryseobacterium rhizosphaerae]
MQNNPIIFFEIKEEEKLIKFLMYYPWEDRPLADLMINPMPQ